ncbi:MAG: glycosyltransferase family 39 protein [Limisphaerales bacterium]
MPTAEPFTPAGASVRRDSLFALAILGGVLAILLALTWRKWPDMLVDFGLQLYIPWRLSMGAVLYRDVAYMTGGPFSQYFDAFMFRCFGVSFLTIAVANLVILAGLLVLVYRGFHRAAGQWTALAASLAILVVFAFEHYSDYGIFNYVTPYSQEIYHGLVLSVAAVALLAAWVSTQKRSAALAAGFCCGLVFLTKPEVFLALAAAAFTALFVAWRVTGRRSAFFKGLGLMVLAGVVPPLAFLVYFLRFAPLLQSLKWTCWAWVPVLATPAMDSPFYRWCMGLDSPGYHLTRMLCDTLGLASLALLCGLIFRRRSGQRSDVTVFAVLAAALAALAWKMFDWLECAHSLPLLCAAALGWLCWRARSAGWTRSSIFMTLWAVFSLVLLAKLGLYVRIWHYGFALAMPAFLTAIYFLYCIVPEWLERFGARPIWWRGLASVLLLTGFVRLELFSKFVYEQKTVAVGEGADRLWTFRQEIQPSGAMMGQALSWMRTNTPADSTLAVLPAGVMLNYMLRRANPTPYLRWNPPEMAVFGQASMTRALEQAKPDYILLLGVDMSEFGVDFFGATDNFGGELMRWINQTYQPVGLLGHDWNKDGQFGIKILKLSGPTPVK